ncbi:MAG: PP2C family protein-serine/threonine phosphatase [Candidatus Promineifilaceae bacterium]
MSNIILGLGRDIGQRNVYEDRVQVVSLQTVGGIRLSVGVIADGVGGANQGERAAQLAIEAVIESLRRSTETNIPALLISTVQAANYAVYAARAETGRMGCTLAIALIVAGTLYVANVGDSRVYLVRNKRVSQLTMDHSFANMMVMQGKLGRKAADANPRAEVLMRALGQKEQVAIDLGFYINTNNYQAANDRGYSGLPLREGDSVMVCSDGLIKLGPDGRPYTTDEEIYYTLTYQKGDKAARELVSFALGRNADDNVSVATLQMPRPHGETLPGKQGAIGPTQIQQIIGIAGVIIAILGVVIYGLLNSMGTIKEDAATLVQQSTQAALSVQGTQQQHLVNNQQAAAQSVFQETTAAGQVAAYTSTPTAAPTLTTMPVLLPKNEGEAFSSTLPDARMWLDAGSDSQISADASGYDGGIQIKFNPDNGVSLTFNGCFSIDYQAESQLTASCYSRECHYEFPNGEGDLTENRQLTIDLVSDEIDFGEISILERIGDQSAYWLSIEGVTQCNVYP